MFNARIIILNYNGENLLPQCLPSLIKAHQKANLIAPVTVLDNLSTDASEKLLRDDYPNISFVKATENLVLCSYNYYLTQVKESIVILLNNDIRVDEDFIPPLLAKFRENPQTFLVAPRVMNFDGSRVDAARTKAKLRFGIFWSSGRYPGHEREMMIPSETFSSGFGAFSREKFLQLGGYDKRFLPGIMEDADLCLRAQRTGFHLYYEPRSVVYHMGQASFKKVFGHDKLQVLAHRNNFLFMWKNFSGLAFWGPHFFFLPLHFSFAILKGNWALVVGFFQALVHSRGNPK